MSLSGSTTAPTVAAPADSAGEHDRRRLGETLRELRQSQGLSLDQLAALSSVSRSMISKVERNEATPTTTVLSRLAEALGVTFSQLMSPKVEAETVILRRGMQPVMVDPESGFERRCLAPILPSRGIDWVQNTLPVGRSTGTFVAHQRSVEEYIYVSEGRLRARLGGGEHILEAGDSLFFQAHVPHAFDNVGTGPCVYFLIIDTRGRR